MCLGSLSAHECAGGTFLQGDKPLDTLRQWRKTYSRDLDQETLYECVETEKILKRALAGGGENKEEWIFQLLVQGYPNPSPGVCAGFCLPIHMAPMIP